MTGTRCQRKDSFIAEIARAAELAAVIRRLQLGADEVRS